MFDDTTRAKGTERRRWMRGARAALAIAVIAACSSSTGAPPAPSYTLAAHTTVLSAEQAETVTVLPDRLVFPRSGNDSLLSHAPGDILVCDRNSTASQANRYGFARKVASAAVVGDTIVVMTSGDASLEDIFANASIDSTATLDQLVQLPILPGQVAQPQSVRPLGLSGGTTFATSFGGDFGPIQIIPKINFQIPMKVNGVPVKLAFDGAASLSQVKFVFTPSLDMGVKIGGFIPSHLDEFHLVFDGASDLIVVSKLDLGFSVKTDAGTDLNKDDRLGLADKVAGFLATSADPNLTPSVSSPDLVDVEVAGPPLGPVPTTFELSLKFVCSLTLKGGVSVVRGGERKGDLKVGIAYDADTGWSPIASDDSTTQDVGPGVTQASGGIVVGCGLQPKLAWKIGAALGPYVSIEGGNRLSATYTETCPSPFPSNLPDGRLTLASDLYLKANGGGEVKVLGYTIFDLSMTLLEGTKNLAKASWDFKDQYVIGTCPSPADSGADAADATSTSDSGGGDGATAGDGAPGDGAAGDGASSDAASDAEAGPCNATQSSCSAGGDCCTGNCLPSSANGFPVHTQCCAAQGTACSQWSDCCGTMACNSNGKCQCVGEFGYCLNDSDCCQSPGTLTCQNGRCHPLCGEVQESCPAAGGCCGAPWDTTQLVCQPTSKNGAPIQSKCCVAQGQPCKGTLDCCGTMGCSAVTNTCACIPAGINNYCLQDSDCCAGLRCAGTPLVCQ